MRADWFLNSHLKLYGMISTAGISHPICEGDNVQVRGILYHLEDLTFEGSIDSQGRKRFMTTLKVSNGVMANSLQGKRPRYAMEGSVFREGMFWAPGTTDVQLTTKENRDDEGEKKGGKAK